MWENHGNRGNISYRSIFAGPISLLARVKRLGMRKQSFVHQIFRDEIRRVNIADLHDGNRGPFWKQWFKDVDVAMDCIYCRACW